MSCAVKTLNANQYVFDFRRKTFIPAGLLMIKAKPKTIISVEAHHMSAAEPTGSKLMTSGAMKKILQQFRGVGRIF